MDYTRTQNPRSSRRCSRCLDPGEQVVEVVCDAAGQDAQAFQLLGLADLLLEPSSSAR